MRSIAFVWSLCLAVLVAACATPVHFRSESVSTASGVVEGKIGDGVIAWLGIPYAAPPIGDLRWKAPQLLVLSNDRRPTKTFAPACMQTGVSIPGEPSPRTSEDCLYLNVWAPAASPKPLPVIVWIHGGGWTNGATSLPLYWGDRLAKRGVVFVSIAYRLGPFGFLAHPELSAEGGGASGNYGLMDQIAALQWVKSNIAAFGGDPANVTIAGQSAGAMSVSLLMASPKGAGLFERAIGQSGGVFEPLELAPNYLLAQAEKDGVAYAKSVGAGSLADLRTMPAEQLLKGQAGSISHPVVEPHVLPMSPYDAYVSGRWNDVPVLIGSNAEEGNSLANLAPVTAATYVSEMKRQWGGLPEPLTNAYTYTTDAEAKAARSAFERDLRFGWDMWAWARLQAKFSKQPVFSYRFAQSPPFPADSVRHDWGPSHFAELWYMFDHLDQESWAWSASDRKLADAMATYWVNFARTGDPNAPGLPRWPVFGGTGETLVLDDTMRVMNSPVDPQLRVFDTVYDAVRGSPVGAAK